MTTSQRVVTPDAARDISDAAFWYEAQRPLLGDRFLEELDRIFAEIVDGPQRFPTIDETARRAALQKFPFSVYFLAEGGVVTVVAVLHHRRHPTTWKRRT